MDLDKEFREAEERGRERRRTTPYAVAVRYDRATQSITVDLNKGHSVVFPKVRSQALANASDDELSEVEVSAGGGSVFFPKLEDGFLIESMLAGRFGNDRWEHEWAERHPESQAA